MRASVSVRRALSLACLLCLFALTSALTAGDILVRDAKLNVLYQYSNDVMYQGPASAGKALWRYNPQNGGIFPGRANNGVALATWKNNALYPKNDTGGRPWYVFANKGGHPGSAGAIPVVFIDGRKIHRGNGPAGELLFYPDAPLPVPVALYLFHTAAGNAPAAPAPKLQVNIKEVPFGFYLGEPKSGKMVIFLRGDRLYYDEAMKVTAFTYKDMKYYAGEDTAAAPVFCLGKDGSVYRGAEAKPENMLLRFDGDYNAIVPGKNGAEDRVIGSFMFFGDRLVLAGRNLPGKQKIDLTRKCLLSATLPWDKIDTGLKVFLIYLTQVDPDFKAKAAANR